MYQSLNNATAAIARWTALVGGLVLLFVVVISCVSIAGRALAQLGIDSGPIPGIYEIVEIGVGFAIFAFLPWCQLQRGHARVDLFENLLGPRLNRVIDLVSDVLIFVIATIIAWRLWLGMLDKQSYSETTWILQIPVWTAYCGALFGAISFVLVSAFCVIRALRTFTDMKAEPSHD